LPKQWKEVDSSEVIHIVAIIAFLFYAYDYPQAPFVDACSVQVQVAEESSHLREQHGGSWLGEIFCNTIKTWRTLAQTRIRGVNICLFEGRGPVRVDASSLLQK